MWWPGLTVVRSPRTPVRCCCVRSSNAHGLYPERHDALPTTAMAKAQCATLRLLKLGPWVRVTVRNVWVSLSQSYPDAQLFAAAHHRLLAAPAH